MKLQTHKTDSRCIWIDQACGICYSNKFISVILRARIKKKKNEWYRKNWLILFLRLDMHCRQVLSKGINGRLSGEVSGRYLWRLRVKKKSCFENKQVHLNFGGCSEVQLISITKIKNLVLNEFCKGISQCRIFWDKNNVRYFFGDKFKLLVPGSSNIATPPLVLQKYVACLLSCRLIKPLPWQPIFTKCEKPNF